jgi:hypothetical protein
LLLSILNIHPLETIEKVFPSIELKERRLPQKGGVLTSEMHLFT